MQINPKEMQKACQKGHLTATDLADFLVQNCNIPFREAHHITGKAVAYAESLNKDISQISIQKHCSVDSKSPQETHKTLDLMPSMNSRNSYGGTCTQATQAQIESLEAWLELAKLSLKRQNEQ